jgi:hypothetical protein
MRNQRGRQADAEATYREAAAAGHRYALRELADWLLTMPGRQADAEATYREAAAAVHTDSPELTADCEAAAEATYREAAAAGDPYALRNLAQWLSTRPGREAEVEATWRAAAAAGDPAALGNLAQWLRARR